MQLKKQQNAINGLRQGNENKGSIRHQLDDCLGVHCTMCIQNRSSEWELSSLDYISRASNR